MTGTRKETIRLSLSKIEKDALRAAATKAGIPLAVWVRMRALEAARYDEARKP